MHRIIYRFHHQGSLGKSREKSTPMALTMQSVKGPQEQLEKLGQT